MDYTHFIDSLKCSLKLLYEKKNLKKKYKQMILDLKSKKVKEHFDGSRKYDGSLPHEPEIYFDI
jgi:hypothetical protein